MQDCDCAEIANESEISVKSDVLCFNEFFSADRLYDNMIEKLQLQKDNEEFSDVVLIAEGKRFPAHRCLLAAFSEYFHKMFTSAMKEKHSKEIQIEEVSAEAMEIIIDSLYSGKLSLSNQSIAYVLHAASMMQVTVVLQVLNLNMIKTINHSNCCFYHQLASIYSFDNVSKVTTKFILQEFDEKIVRDKLVNHDFEDIKTLLASDNLIVKEEKSVFEFIIKWVERRLEIRKQYFPSLFKLVRLQFIAMVYVTDVIVKNRLVREFHECNKLINSAISFYLHPKFLDCQPLRKWFGGEPDSMSFLSLGNKKQRYYDFQTNILDEVSFKGFNGSTALLGCAFAEKFPAVVLCGGIAVNHRATSQVVRFDGVRWMNMPSMIECRYRAAAAFYNEDLYVFGGEKLSLSPDGNFKTVNLVKNFEKFSNFTWTKDTQATSLKFNSHLVALVINEYIYLIGGYRLTEVSDLTTANQIPNKLVSANTLKYFPEEDIWKESTNMNHARADFAAVAIKGKIIVVGGYGNDDIFLHSMEIFSHVNEAWTIIQSSLPMRQFNCNTFGNTQFIYANGILYLHFDNILFKFEVKSKTWKELKHFIQPAFIVIPYAKRFHLHPLLSENTS